MTWFKNYKLCKLINEVEDLEKEKEALRQIVSTVKDTGVIDTTKKLEDRARSSALKYKLFNKAKSLTDSWERCLGEREKYHNYSPSERSEILIKYLLDEIVVRERKIEQTVSIINKLKFKIYRG